MIIASHYYISSGSQNKMYTLRFYQKFYVDRGEGMEIESMDRYECTLSADLEKAKAKAKSIVGEPVNFVNAGELEEITRRSSETVAEEKARAEKARAEQYRKNKEEQEKKHLAMVEAGVMPFGKHREMKIAELPKDYVLFFIGQEVESDDVVPVAIKAALIAAFPDLVSLPESNGQFYGEIKKREEITATLIASFGFDGFYGYTNVYQFVKDTGELLVYMGSAELSIDQDDLEISVKYKFKATIKAHEEYKGENQTKLARISNLVEA